MLSRKIVLTYAQSLKRRIAPPWLIGGVLMQHVCEACLVTNALFPVV